MLSAKRLRGFLKDVGHSVKDVFKPGGQAPSSRGPSPPPRVPSTDPPRQLTPSHEPAPANLAQPLAQSQPILLFQPEPSPSQPTPSQPTLTPSLLAVDDNQPVKAESSLALAAKKAGSEAWTGLKAALRLLEKSSDVFPPLKSAVGGFLGVVDIFESAAENQKNYAELALDLQGLVNDFKEHPGEQSSSNMSKSLKAMASQLRKHVEEQQGRSGYKRHAEAGQDVADVQECFRRVENLRRALQHEDLLEILSDQNTALDEILVKQADQNVALDKILIKQEDQTTVLNKIQSTQEGQDADARLNAALNAMYNSSLSDVVGRRMCTTGTREAILAGIRKWADDSKGPKVYWLNGMAGTGKTTLAYSFCAEMQRARRLGASFFCSRTDTDSRDVLRIVPTIAHQLARLLPSYREALIRQMNDDKDIVTRNTRTLFEKLIRDPLHEIKASVPEGVVVTIDALDECDRRDGAQDILDVLFFHARDLPIKFFVTCRPEPGLFDTLRSKDDSYRSVLHLHDIEASFVQADITTYLKDELSSLALPQDKLGQLAEHAGTLFIYAATAVRYIHPKGRSVNPHRRLEDVLSMISKNKTSRHKGIDELYLAVLVAPFADDELNAQEKATIRLVLDTAVCAKEPMSATTMTKLLGLDDEQDIICATEHLRSILHYSDGAGLISTFHASFPDFMLSRERSGDLCCNVAEHNQRLAAGCLSTMQRSLRFNICELESSFVLDKDILDLAKRIDKAIPPELFYACRYWGDHLEFAEASSGIRPALEKFLSNRLLFWMEVLNLKKLISAGAQILAQVQVWLQKSGGANDVLELAQDAGRFLTAFSLSPGSRSTPHIYMSALPFWPEKHPVRLRYWNRTQGLIRLEGSGMEGRDLSCLATWNTGSDIACLAQSPDGARIVTGSDDNNICVWDAQSGELVVGPFEGHTGSVNSVGFSPDGTRIVSGSDDNTIRVWDAQSGDLVAGPFEGHTDSVSSVSFSPGGTRIVSGSDDNTIRIWDAQSGVLVAGPFEGHTDSVSSVSFSPGGTRIVSGSDDNTIRVWDAQSGELVAGPFEGHTDSVNSVGFSPDGTRIVSGSEDKTIRVWDAQSGDLVAGPFQAHILPVSSVEFSPDGTRIVSGSDDSTICVWDAQSGELVAGPFEGHTNWVTSVGFSPDGTRIVSGSYDKTIRFWDAKSRNLVTGPSQGHTKIVFSVGFSPDGTRIVSGSQDHTIRVWDAQSGDLVAGPFEGHTNWVFSVGFSPDGTRIVSCSYDGTIRVWDAQTGDLVAGPFEGHTDSVNSVGFSSDGTRIVSGSDDHTIRVWDAHSGDLVAGPFEGHTDSVKSVGFSPDGTRIVSSSQDHTIRVWDVQSGNLVAGPFEGHTDSVNSVGFSPDGARIVSGALDSTIRVWDAQSGELVAGPFEGHTSWVFSVGFSPDGTRIVSGSLDNTIRVWDALSGDLVAGPFEGHTGPVYSVGFSPDGTRIVSGSHDHAIRVWSTAPSQVHDPEHLNNWLMDPTGMITTQQGQLLLCFPSDLWPGVVRLQNTVCIRAKGVLKLEFDGIFLGSEWTKCYQRHECFGSSP